MSQTDVYPAIFNCSKCRYAPIQQGKLRQPLALAQFCTAFVFVLSRYQVGGILFLR